MRNETVIRRLLADLRDGDVSISTKLPRGLKGAFDANSTLKVSKTLTPEERLVTLIHEYLHYLDSSTPEETVEARAYEVFTILTPGQYGLLYFFLEEAIKNERHSR